MKEIQSAWNGEDVVSTSCSLLHVPYTVKNEQKLDSSILEHFAFAEEKLTELKDIASGDSKAFA